MLHSFISFSLTSKMFYSLDLRVFLNHRSALKTTHKKPHLMFYFQNYKYQKLLMNRSDKSVGANIDSCIATNIRDILLMRCVSSTEFLLDSSALTNAEPESENFDIHFLS